MTNPHHCRRFPGPARGAGPGQGSLCSRALDHAPRCAFTQRPPSHRSRLLRSGTNPDAEVGWHHLELPTLHRPQFRKGKEKGEKAK